MVQIFERFITNFWLIYLVIYLSGIVNVGGIEDEVIREFLPKKNDLTSPTPFIRRNSYNKYAKHKNVKRETKRPFFEYGSIEGPCRNFIEGDVEAQMFTTPALPDDDKYPNKTDCVRVIEAPKDHLILLDFREYFELEQSQDCKFDYLEVRDGAYGFSDLIGVYCGVGFPDMITSSGRYLWLHFSSDDSIELRGFKAVFEFVPRPTNIPPEFDACEINYTDVEGFINKTDISDERINKSIDYRVALDCMWTITVKENWKIQLNFIDYKLDRPNECDNNFIDIFSNKTDIPSRLKTFCGSIPDSVASKGNILFIRFYAAVNALNSTFSILYTAYRDRGETAKNCNAGEYDCQDNTCIDDSLRCNNRINCRYRWDEQDCVTKKKNLPEHIIIIMVVFCLIVSGMCAAFIFNCVRKLMRDHRLIQEHIRQSRENRLDEIKSRKKKSSSSKDDLKKSTISLIVPPTAVTMPPPPLPPAQVMQGRMSPTNSVHSSSSQGFPIQNPCYVPSRGLHQDLIPILKDTRTMNSCEEGPEVVPEMCDMACQTRESLFTTTPHRSLSTFSGGNNSINNQSYGWKVQASQHSQDSSKHTSNDLSQTTSQRSQPPYRAEVAIEVQQQQPEKSASPGHTNKCQKQHRPQQRPYSVQTTKSAPDVIVTH
ncbi:uncharacterized protein LOC123304958 isoform X2 [Chrysoperla carnea]|uniref:uncharacterized protein LOC123304958 isoform X2 n=1 Tax=Chrysoperla carnea TaxID=189513 RepID=UPI001D06A9B5|nr:uncharacterized protein LOC123304958 isoform X2 [Chrysoperla carnea]